MNKKILFIEDEAVMQKAVSEFLGVNGYSVVSALDGELGVRAAQAEKPDLILLDIILPKKNGFEVLKDLKSGPETKSIPVIVLTNLSEMGDVGKILELGVTTYLVKSDQSLKDILAIVERTLGNNSL
ncbi:MAG: response regulator [Candidatus Paceibacterota bacterium]